MQLLCDGGPPQLRLAQSRLLLLGAAAAAAAKAKPLWHVPMLLRTPGGLTQQWLLGRQSPTLTPQANTLDPSLRAGVLGVAAINRDSTLFNTPRAALDSSTQRQERQDLLGALAHFQDPALAQRARALLLDPALDIREVRWPLQRAHNQNPVLRDGLLACLQQHHANLVKRLGRDKPAGRPEALNLACGRDDADCINTVFAPHAARFQGGQRALAQALKSMRLCAAWRAPADGALDAP